MDVVMADVPPKFGMFLSRSWASKLKGTLQMNLLYAIIPVFNEQRRLYREKRLAYMISNRENLENHPIYSVNTDIGSSMLFNDAISKGASPSQAIIEVMNQTNKVQKLNKKMGLMVRLH
jgi:hypothetical protein